MAMGALWASGMRVGKVALGTSLKILHFILRDCSSMLLDLVVMNEFDQAFCLLILGALLGDGVF